MNTPAELFHDQLGQAINARVFGMESATHALAIALLAGGHVLVEGVPGIGKTMFTRTAAQSLGGQFGRIQCTADLMPADITGVHIFNTARGEFEFAPGPLFADVVLVDEINRTGPRTQSALLEAMEEGTVSIDRQTHALPRGFVVLASQNPHEFEGTYPLPESQLDRFLLRLRLDYPGHDDELAVMRCHDRPASEAPPAAADVIDPARIDAARAQLAEIHVADSLREYIYRIAQATRQDHRLSLGVSTRGMLALARCARANAALRGADFVDPDDVKQMAPAVLAHRLLLTPESQIDGVSADEVCAAVLEDVVVPR